MGESFKKLKTKYLILAIIKSVMAGVAAALACVGLALICVKLCVTSIPVWCYAVIGVGAAAVAGVATFFALRGNDKKLAKNIDVAYGLQEKVQTLVEFAGQDGEIIDVQRQDASATLASLPARPKDDFVKFIGCIAAIILSCAVFVTAVVLPADAGSVFDPGNDKYVAKESQVDSLNRLIEDVEGSALEDGLKDGICEALCELRDGLSNVTNYGVADAVGETVKTVDGLIFDANSYKTVCPELGKYQRTALLARALNDSVVTYQSRKVKITTYVQVENLFDLVEESKSIEDAISPSVTAMRETLNIPKNSTEASLAAALSDTVSCFDKTATACEKYADDGFLTALVSYADGVRVLYEKLDSYTETYIQNTLDSLSDTLVTDSAEALHGQAFNRMMQDFIRNKIAEIFADVNYKVDPLDDSVEVNLPADDDGDNGEGGGEGGDEEGDGENQGSGGDMETEFGSDDKIFNPMTGEYVSYLELLDYYRNLADQKDVSDESMQYFEDYFNSLTQSKSDS